MTRPVVSAIMGAIFVGDDASRNRVRAAFSWQLDDDDACERLGGVGGSADGRELGPDLDGGRDNVGRVISSAVTVGVIRVWTGDGLDRIVGIGVKGLWNRASCSGGIATRIEVGRLAVAHASEGCEFCERRLVGT